MNLGGNVAECASIATVAALAHFKRPDVTIVGKEVSIIFIARFFVIDFFGSPLVTCNGEFCSLVDDNSSYQ